MKFTEKTLLQLVNDSPRLFNNEWYCELTEEKVIADIKRQQKKVIGCGINPIGSRKAMAAYLMAFYGLIEETKTMSVKDMCDVVGFLFLQHEMRDRRQDGKCVESVALSFTDRANIKNAVIAVRSLRTFR